MFYYILKTATYITKRIQYMYAYAYYTSLYSWYGI